MYPGKEAYMYHSSALACDTVEISVQVAFVAISAVIPHVVNYCYDCTLCKSRCLSHPYLAV